MIRDILYLTVGTGAAQVASFAFIPYLSREYGPSQYGELGVALAVSAVLTRLLGVQLNQAMLISDDARERSAVFVSSVAAMLAQVLVLAVLAELAVRLLPSGPLSRSADGLVAPVLALGLASAMHTLLHAWAACHSRYRAMGTVVLLRTLAVCLFQVALADGPTPNGLVYGFVLGEAVILAFALWLMSVGEHRLVFHRVSRADVGACFRRHRQIVLFATGRELLFSIAAAIPVTAVSALFGSVVAGQFAMAMRLLDAPVNLTYAALLTTTSRAFAATRSDPTRASADLRRWVLNLAALGAAMLVATVVLADWAVDLLLGPGWDSTAAFLIVIAVWKAIGFSKAPATTFLYVSGRDRRTFLYQLGATSALLLGLWAASAAELAAIAAVGVIAAVGLAVDLAFIVTAFAIARDAERVHSESA